MAEWHRINVNNWSKLFARKCSFSKLKLHIYEEPLKSKKSEISNIYNMVSRCVSAISENLEIADWGEA